MLLDPAYRAFGVFCAHACMYMHHRTPYRTWIGPVSDLFLGGPILLLPAMLGLVSDLFSGGPILSRACF